MKKFEWNVYLIYVVALNILLMILRFSVLNPDTFTGNIFSTVVFFIIVITLLILIFRKEYDYFILTWLSFYFAAPIIRLPFVSIGSLGLLNAIFIPIMIIILFNPKNKYYLLICALMIYSIINFADVPFRLIASRAFDFVAPLLFFYFVMKKCKNINLIIWGSIFVSLINMPLIVYEIIAHPIWGGSADWRGFRIFGNLFWHNSFSVYLLPSLLILYSSFRIKFSKGIFLLFVILLLADIFTFSRAGLLGLLVGISILEFIYKSGQKQTMKNIILVLLFILMFVFYMFSGLEESRLGMNAIRERTGIWKSIIPLMHNLITGNGLGSYELYRGEVVYSLSPHNYYLGLIFELGLIGLLIVGIFLYKMIKSFYNGLKDKKARATAALALSIMISLLICSFVGEAAFSQVVALNSWIILGCLMIKKDEESDKK